MREYPEELYRGISSPNDIVDGGYVSAGAFQFGSYNPEREDEYCELSVNWNDNEESLQVLLNQHKIQKDEKQFKGGYCVIKRRNLNLMLKDLMETGEFSYERQPIKASEKNGYQKNLYHGNLLMKNTLHKQVKKNIQHTLALMAGQAVRR